MALRMLRSFNTKVTSLYQYFNLIFGTATYQAIQPSDHVIQTAGAIFELLVIRRSKALRLNGVDDEEDEGGDEAAVWRLVRKLLRECCELDSLAQVTNDDGYNVLLKAVLQNDIQVLEMLTDEGCSLNSSKCTLPLHLACKLGNLPLVKYLLEEDASPDQEAGMCYPHDHIPVVHVPSRFHFLEADIYACDSDYRLPLMYAIEEDQLEVVRYLLERRDGGKDRWPHHRHPLHQACRYGAYASMEYLAQSKPGEIQISDEEGLTPLLYVVPWGRKYVKFLVEAEANVHAVTYKKQGALHLLYANIKDPLELYGTTKFLLGTGMEGDVNLVDHQGNSPLHALASLLNRLVTSFPHHTFSSSAADQRCYDGQVVETMELLLKFNCDPNLVNNSGVTALHKLVLTLDFVISNDPNGITLDTLPAREKYKTDFEIVHKALMILLEHGAKPDLTTSAGRTALIILLQMALTIDPTRIPAYKGGLLKCMRLLCESGANPSCTMVSHINIVTLLSKIAHKVLLVRQAELQTTLSEFLQDILALLLRYGLAPNHCSKRKQPPIEGASGNILLELIKLVQFIRQPPDLLLIHGWILTLLQWGANPDIEPYPSEPIICQSQSSIFLQPKGTQAVNQYMYELQDLNQIFEGGHACKLLMLFYNSMDHNALYQCMNTAKFLSRFDPNRAPTAQILQQVTKLSSRPRSLKHNARVTIYKAMDRQLNLGVPQLPLPTAIKEYLVNIE
jgi:ankyrin repeat protein